MFPSSGDNLVVLLKSLQENQAKVLLAMISVMPRETSAAAGNNASYAPSLLRRFLRVPPVI